jgi:hypothetical protein
MNSAPWRCLIRLNEGVCEYLARVFKCWKWKIHFPAPFIRMITCGSSISVESSVPWKCEYTYRAVYQETARLLGFRSLITVSMTLQLDSVLSHLHPFYTITSYFHMIHIQFLRFKSSMHFSSPHVCYTFYPSHPFLSIDRVNVKVTNYHAPQRSILSIHLSLPIS